MVVMRLKNRPAYDQTKNDIMPCLFKSLLELRAKSLRFFPVFVAKLLCICIIYSHFFIILV